MCIRDRHKAAELLQKYEGMEWQQLIPEGEFPELLDFHPTKDYVREVLAEQVTLTAQDEEFVEVDDLPNDFRFFSWNAHVNGRVQDVPSHRVIRDTQKKDGEDYRLEDAESPIPELRSRTEDNTKLGRIQGAGHDLGKGGAQTEEVEEVEVVMA